MNCFRPRKQKFNPKKSSIEVKWERMQDFLDTEIPDVIRRML